MAAGRYPTRFAWLDCPLGAGDPFGQKRRDTPALLGHLWGSIGDFTAAEEQVLDATRLVSRATVKLRNAVDVAPRQRLRDDSTGLTWTVSVAWPGDNETVVEVYRQ